jgi:transposase
MAGWIAGPVAQRLPDAVRCVDPFHVVMLATDALDEIRRDVWNDARRSGEVAVAKDLKGARYALWKNPEVRHEAPLHPGGDERTPPLVRRSGPVKLRAA